MRKIFKHFLIQVKSLKSSSRFYLFLLYNIYFILDSNFTSFRVASPALSYRVTPWVFNCFAALFYRQFLTGAIILFADSPFAGESYIYELTRSDKKTWFKSRIFYIFAMSLLYFLSAFVFCILLLTPYVYFSSDWGKLLKSIVLNSQTANNFNVGWFYYMRRSMFDISGLASFFLTMSIFVIQFMIVALIMFLFSQFEKKNNRLLPIVAAFAYAMLPSVIELSIHRMQIVRYLPAYWMRTDRLIFNLHRSPKETYGPLAICILLIILLFLLIFNWELYKRNDPLRIKNLDEK